MKHHLPLCVCFTVFVAADFFAAETPSVKTAGGKTDASLQKPVPPPSPYPDPAVVLEVMKDAAAFFRRDVSFAGGYAWKWPKDLSIAKGEDRESPTLIMMQPPGTPSVGLAMLKAYQATGDKLFLQGAKEAAQALMWCQLASGGWDSEFDFNPRKSRTYHFRRDIEAGDTEPAGRRGQSTLDDDKTQSALLFLLELAHTEACKDDVALRAALKAGFDGLLAAQAPNGGWGQQYHGAEHADAPVTKAKIPAEWPRIWPATNYTRHYTLNDHNLREVMRVLLRARQLENDERFLTAARKLGDFLLRAQLPEPQPAWAQQYNRDMEPVWARKFEPPAVSSLESVGAIEALIELWLATGDRKFLQSIPPAIAWLERSRLPDGRWARFYELGTNQPLYCKAHTYEVTYDDSDLPNHYGFKISADLASDIAAAKTKLETPREELLSRKAPPTVPKKWASRAKGLASKVSAALQSADIDLKSAGKKRGWLKDDLIDAGTFVENLTSMSAYVEAAKKGGAAFEVMRKSKPEPKPFETK